MKIYQNIALIFAAVVATCASAFSATRLPSTPFKTAEVAGNKAAVATFTTAMAPFAANAAEVDNATAIGFGTGLVACVVSLAVGFSIGYGTLVKP